MSQILSLNTECHILPVSRGHLRDRRDFIVLFQFTLDIAESRLYGNGTSPLRVQQPQQRNTALNGKEMGAVMQSQIHRKKKPRQCLYW